MKENINIFNRVNKKSILVIGDVMLDTYQSNQTKGALHKLISKNIVKEFRNRHLDKTIVFTNGCFDIMHVGYARYLQEAAKLGDILNQLPILLRK